MAIIIIGLPGIGKGTVSKYIEEKYKLKHISTGDLLRKEMADKTPLGLEITNLMNEGKFVSDETINTIVSKLLKQETHVILDGYPRTVEQAKFIDKSGIKIDFVIYLKGDTSVAKSRALSRANKEGRSDDTPDVISSRIEKYFLSTLPIIDFYKGQGKVVTIDGNLSAASVRQNIDKIMN